jgi:hypothetical protein
MLEMEPEAGLPWQKQRESRRKRENGKSGKKKKGGLSSERPALV